MKVDVYFNLHKKLLSVRHKGRVIHHSNYVKIINPTFVVSEAGRQRVIREKRKNFNMKSGSGFIGSLFSTFKNKPHFSTIGTLNTSIISINVPSASSMYTQ